MTYDLPIPPTVNTYWRNVNGRTLLSKKGREFKQTVGWKLKEYGCKPLTGRLSVHVQLWFPDRRKRDIDNYVKSLLDALNGRVFEDDSQVDHLVVTRDGIVKGGRCRVWVEEM